MSVGGLVAIYFVVWWIVLFVVLPWGVRTQEEDGNVTLGTAPGAPVRPLLVRKALATSVIAAILVGGLWLAVAVYGFDLYTIAGAFDVRR